MPRGPHIPLEKRISCVLLRYYTGMQHAAIATELNMVPSTVRNTYSRIQKAASGSTNILDLLLHCGTCPRSGFSLKITPSSEEANAIRTEVKAKKHQIPEEVANWVLNRQQQ